MSHLLSGHSYPIPENIARHGHEAHPVAPLSVKQAPIGIASSNLAVPTTGLTGDVSPVTSAKEHARGASSMPRAEGMTEVDRDASPALSMFLLDFDSARKDHPCESPS